MASVDYASTFVDYGIGEPMYASLGAMEYIVPGPPVLSDLTPPNGSTIQAADAIQFALSGAGITGVTIEAVYADATRAAIYNGTTFAPGFEGSSEALGVYTIACDAGWPSETVELDIRAYNAAPAAMVEAAVYSVSDPVVPVPPDAEPPVISNVEPAPGTPIFATSTLSFDVTDNVGFRRIMAVNYRSDNADVVYDGDQFRGPYVVSQKIAIPGGYRFRIARHGGWRENPKIVFFPIDTSGNEAI